MQFSKTDRDQLLRPLQIVNGIVERRNTIPILANVLMRKDGPSLSFLASDVEVQITVRTELGSGGDSGATTVAARKLLDILRALPDTGDVSLTAANKRMTVAAGKSRFNLQTLPAEEFPGVSIAENYGARFSMPQKTLKHLFQMVHFSMAQQDIRYYLNGLLLVVDGNQVKAVATDGHRLAYCVVEVDESHPHQEVIVPRKTILELQRLLADSDDGVDIEIAPQQVRFTFGSIELISKLIEGKFPDYQRVIPNGYTRSFAVPRELLQNALQRVAILTSEKFQGVRCVLAPGSLRISSTNADQEDAQDELEVDYTGEGLDIGFNVRYLLEVLGNLSTENVRLAFGDSNSSALITVDGSDAFKYVVMPMRI